MNPKDLPDGKGIVDYLVGETDGGLDFTFDATGNVCLICSNRKGGKLMSIVGRCDAERFGGVSQRLGSVQYHRCGSCWSSNRYETVRVHLSLPLSHSYGL